MWQYRQTVLRADAAESPLCRGDSLPELGVLWAISLLGHAAIFVGAVMVPRPAVERPPVRPLVYHALWEIEGTSSAGIELELGWAEPREPIDTDSLYEEMIPCCGCGEEDTWHRDECDATVDEFVQRKTVIHDIVISCCFGPCVRRDDPEEIKVPSLKDLLKGEDLIQIVAPDWMTSCPW